MSLASLSQLKVAYFFQSQTNLAIIKARVTRLGLYRRSEVLISFVFVQSSENISYWNTYFIALVFAVLPLAPLVDL